MKTHLILIGIVGMLFLYMVWYYKNQVQTYKKLLKQQRQQMQQKQQRPIIQERIVPIIQRSVRYDREMDPLQYPDNGMYFNDLEWSWPLYTTRWSGGGFYNGSYKTYTI